MFQTELVTTLEGEVDSLRAKVRRYRQQVADHGDAGAVGAGGGDDDDDAE
jgi:hypothetical protein